MSHPNMGVGSSKNDIFLKVSHTIIDMLFIFHKFSVYTNSPFKEMEYVAKSFVILDTTKVLWI